MCRSRSNLVGAVCDPGERAVRRLGVSREAKMILQHLQP